MSASSSVSASTCTTPVSHLERAERDLALDRQVEQPSRAPDVRTPMRVSGRLARMALMTSIVARGVTEAVAGNVEDDGCRQFT